MDPLLGLDADQDVTPYLGAMKAGGLSFLMGYLKVLTIGQVEAAHAQGFAVGLIFEAGAMNALAGEAQGLIDGKRARDQATSLGVPIDRSVAIYATVDTSVGSGEPEEMRQVEAYFAAFDTVIFNQFQIGGYADGSALDDLRGHGLPDEWLPGAMGWEGSRAYLVNRLPTLLQGPTLDGGEWPTGDMMTMLKLSKPFFWPKLGIPGGYDPDICFVSPSEAGLWMPPA